MIYVEFEPSNLSGELKKQWETLQKKLEAAAKIAVVDGHKSGFAFKSELWSELKQWLLDHVFYGKCAYCESKVTTTDWGDADHFRPKRAVTILNGENHKTVICNGEKHHGYYWLAYHWKNILPACGRCNSGGKKNLFPVAKVHVHSPTQCLEPDELDQVEDPLLLHPYKTGDRDPILHICFGINGTVAPLNNSPLGEMSIKVYGLKRAALCEDRREAQEKAETFIKYNLAMEQDEAIYQWLTEYRQGKKPYSRAVLEHCLRVIEQREHKLKAFKKVIE